MQHRARRETSTPDKPEASNEALVEDLTKKAHDLDAVRKSVEDAASISGTLWFSYLFTLLYIAIAAGAVTHKDLLLENPVKLPFLNVELPLVAFFALAPILFIIAHAYTLMHFVMLAAKVGTYDTELREKLSGKEADTTRLGLRRQLPSNIFVQFLAGPSDIREGGLGWLLKAVAWISLVIGPVLLLLLLQIQFLPYHLWWVTWVQRFAVFADLTLLWFLWPAVLASRSAIRWPRLWRYPVLTIVSLAPIGVAFVAARFPGESLDALYGAKKWMPSNIVTAWLGAVNHEGYPIPTSLHDLLFNGPVNNITLRRKSLFSNTLVLLNFDALDSKGIDDQKKLDWAKHSLVLRGRHLEGAVFTSADLRKADLEGAQLQGASLNWAQLQGASLHNAQLQGAFLIEARLQGASLDGAGLQGAYFRGAILVATNLSRVEIWRANFLDAQIDKVLGAGLHETAMSKQDFIMLKGHTTKSLPEDHSREILNRVEILNPDNTTATAPDHNKLYAATTDELAYQQALAGELKSLVCSNEDSAAFIVKGLVRSRRFDETGPFASQLAADMLACLSASILAETGKAELQKIEKDAAAKSPAQAGEAAPSTAQNKHDDLQKPKNHRTKK